MRLQEVTLFGIYMSVARSSLYIGIRLYQTCRLYQTVLDYVRLETQAFRFVNMYEVFKAKPSCHSLIVSPEFKIGTNNEIEQRVSQVCQDSYYSYQIFTTVFFYLQIWCLSSKQNSKLKGISIGSQERKQIWRHEKHYLSTT